MIVVTTDDVCGKRIVRTLGLARGNTIRARHIGKDIMAVFRNIVGGEGTPVLESQQIRDDLFQSLTSRPEVQFWRGEIVDQRLRNAEHPKID